MIRYGCPREEFDFMEVIGAGSFGSVHRAVQKSSQKVVAIKIMKRKLTSATECDHLLECKILRLLPSHTNIVKTYDIFFTPTNELYFVMEYMNGGNLYQLIKEKRDVEGCFTQGELRDIMQQTLEAVSHIHANHIFHRDLKPENLLLSTATGVPIIKLADFGLARETSSCPPYTEYVSTRWYRAPEVLLRSSNYSDSVDLWAIGTIFAELITRQPLFPGESEIDQLYRICQVLGSPGNKVISSSVTKKKHLHAEKRVSPGFARRKPDTKPAKATTKAHPYERTTSTTTNTVSTISLLDGGGEWREGVKLAHRIGFEFPHLLPQPLADIVPGATPTMLDLLHQFLFFNPSQRLRAADALHHAFFKDTTPEDCLVPPPPYIGKRRQHSTDTVMIMMDESKQRKTDDGSASASSYYITTTTDMEMEDNIHTHRSLLPGDDTCLVDMVTHHQEDSVVTSPLGGESTDWLWLKVL